MGSDVLFVHTPYTPYPGDGFQLATDSLMAFESRPGLYEEAEIKKSGPKWPKPSTVEWVKSGFGATKIGDPGHKKRIFCGIYGGFHKWGYPKMFG